MRLLRAILLSLVVLISMGSVSIAQKSPFGVPAPGTQQAPSSSEKNTTRSLEQRAGQPSFIQRAWTAVLAVQRDLHRQLAAAVRKLKSDGGFAAAWFLASLSFIYGIVHAVGPGHGKAVISSYVLASERTVRRGISLSFLAALVQAVSAIVLVAILAVAMNAAGLKIRAMESYLESASYALIALVGMWLVVSQMRRILSRGAKDADVHVHAHSHDHDCGHAHMPDPQHLKGDLSWRKGAAIVFAVGVRPCSGAVIVLVFALANGMFFAGVAATFAMALGTAITVSMLAVLAVASKQLAFRLAGESETWSGWIANVVGLVGSILVLMFGITLFVGSFGPARPF